MTFTLSVNFLGITTEIEAESGDTVHAIARRALSSFFPGEARPVPAGCQMRLDGAALELEKSVQDQGVEEGAMLTLHLPF